MSLETGRDAESFRFSEVLSALSIVLDLVEGSRKVMRCARA